MAQQDHQLMDSYVREAAPLTASITRAVNGDRQLAEDIAQESWLRAVLWWPLHGAPERPGAWLRTVSRNLLSNSRRRRPTTSLDAVPTEFLGTPDVGALHETGEQHALLHEAVADLPEEARQLIESFYFHDRPIAEIAQSVGISHRAVEGRLRRTRIRLRAVLESRGITGAELRGVAPTFDLSLVTLGKAILMSAVLPWLAILAGYFVARRLAAKRSPQGRNLGYALGGLGLLALGTLEAPDARPLQLFGLGIMLFGAWRLLRQVPSNSSV